MKTLFVALLLVSGCMSAEEANDDPSLRGAIDHPPLQPESTGGAAGQPVTGRGGQAGSPAQGSSGGASGSAGAGGTASSGAGGQVAVSGSGGAAAPVPASYGAACPAYAVGSVYPGCASGVCVAAGAGSVCGCMYGDECSSTKLCESGVCKSVSALASEKPYTEFQVNCRVVSDCFSAGFLSDSTHQLVCDSGVCVVHPVAGY